MREDKDIIKELKRIRPNDIVNKQWLLSTRKEILSRIGPDGFSESESFSQGRFRYAVFSMLKPVPLVLVLLMLFVSGISVAAGKTLPGDFLYNWKIGVNEPVKLALTVSDAGRIDYQIKLVNKRFAELTELAVRPSGDLNVLKEANSNAEEQLNQTQSEIKELATVDDKAALEATVKLKATVDTQKKIIDHLERKDPVKSKQLSETSDVVEKSASALEEQSKDLSDKEKETITSESGNPEQWTSQKIALVLEKLETTIKLVSNVENGDILTGEAKEDVKSASLYVQKAQVAIEEEDYKEAVSYAQEAVELIAKAEALADTAEQASPEVKEALLSSDTESTAEDYNIGDLQESREPASKIIILPSGDKIVLSIVTDKFQYKAGEPIAIMMNVENKGDRDVRLQWNTGCETSYEIVGVFDLAKERLCTQVLASEILKAKEGKTWKFDYKETLAPGKYTIKGVLLGYGSVEIGITVTEGNGKQTGAEESKYVDTGNEVSPDIASVSLEEAQSPKEAVEE